MAVSINERRTLLLASIPWLLIAAVVMSGLKSFEITDQAWALWDRRYTPIHVFAGGHPHALRYLLYWPIFELSVWLSVPPDQAFTTVSMVVLLGTIAVMVRCEHLLPGGASTRPRMRSVAYSALMMLLALSMNGRLIYPFAGYALAICAALDFLAHGRWSLWHLGALVIGGFLSSVSSGTLAVTSLFVTLFVLWTGIAHFRSPAMIRLSSSAALFMVLFIGPVVVGLYKNLEFFGGGISGAINMLSHGAGRIFLKFGTPGLVILGLLATVGFLAFVWLSRTQSKPMFVLTLAVVPAALGGLFGISTLAMGIVPLMLLLRVDAARELIGERSRSSETISA